MGAPDRAPRGRGSDAPSRDDAVVTDAAVPDSASLAPPVQAAGLELLGEVGGSGYRNAPALARRADGQTIQLTPLLYRLLQKIDGTRSYDELADALSGASGRLVTAEDVRFLVDAKLRPLGVLRSPDGSEPRTRKANPLLGLRCKLVLSNTRVTNTIAGIFAPLFHWTAVVAVLVAFFATTWWLAFDMGIASAAHQALYEPALLLLVLGLTFASAAFHEIGHAAACRFGGAKPGGMGVGLYLVWPAFYTDVSDAYRLGRAGRLRVDLGGLYFNAIFGLATLGLWALVDWDALLLVILAQLVMMVRQLTPIVRFDGYHVLADATGVPDLFHHIKPTLLGLLPGRRGRANGNPLKRWVRVVVTLWVLTVVPLLGALLTLMVLFVPRIVATAWDSLGLREAALEAGWARGDVAAVTLALLSMVTVSLPVLGIAYLLWRIAGRTAHRVWAGTAGRPALRAGAALAGAVVVAAVTWAWWPGEQYRPIEANEPLSLASPLPDGLHGAAYVVNTYATGGFPTAEEPTGAAPAGDAQQKGHWTFVLIPQSAIPDGTAGAAAPPPARASDWAFPFDPPPAPKEGDNQAVAINTTDGSSVYDVALALVWVTDGGPVEQWNQAWALASCTGCDTTAVAFQVVVIVGYAQVITPLNSAVAVNYLCDDCATQALAMQLVTTIATMPSDEALAELADVWAALESASDDFDLQPLAEVQADLLAARTAILDILASEGASGTSTADDTAGAGTTTTTSPTTTAATTTTPTTTTTAEEPAPAGDSTTSTTTTGETTATGETTTTTSEETSSGDAPAAEEQPTTTGETTTTGTTTTTSP